MGSLCSLFILTPNSQQGSNQELTFIMQVLSKLLSSREKIISGTVQENYFHIDYTSISGGKEKKNLNSAWFALNVTEKKKKLHLPRCGDQTWGKPLTQNKQKNSKQTKLLKQN